MILLVQLTLMFHEKLKGRQQEDAEPVKSKFSSGVLKFVRFILNQIPNILHTYLNPYYWKKA